MKDKNDLQDPFDQFNAAAYPSTIGFDGGNSNYTVKGLSKRELFAAMAMQGILASTELTVFEYTADIAVKCADDLLRELNKGKEDSHE